MTAPPEAPCARISAAGLIRFATVVCERAGLMPDDARLVADTLVQADLWGHQSHGLMRLSWYLARLRSGVVAARAQPEFVVDAGAVAVLDGRDAMGQVVAAAAARSAVTRSKAHGVGVVAVRNSNHFGAAMYFTRTMAQAGCVGFLSSNSSPAMPPWGGREKAVGANPWSWAAPAGRAPPMMLDIANTGAARGKIYLARQKGEPIPLGWALDAEGHATDDPLEALRGVILPMAEHKGYAIAVIIDMLSGVLSGSAFGRGVSGPYQTERAGGVGHLTIALDIAAFQPMAEFGARMEALIAELKAAPLAVGHEEITYPGEREARSDERHRRDGLELPPETLTDLAQLAARYDCLESLPFTPRV